MIDYRRFIIALAASMIATTAIITATTAMDQRAYLPLVRGAAVQVDRQACIRPMACIASCSRVRRA
jgi:hypothetical protein